MDSKNYTQVLIDGKIYTLGGSEDEGYLQKTASYVNEKNNTLRKIPGFSKQSVEYRTAMVELNIADDYFKALEHSSEVERQRDDMEREMYSLKHELVSTQMKLEVVLKDLEERQRELEEVTREKNRLDRKVKSMEKAQAEAAEAARADEAAAARTGRPSFRVKRAVRPVLAERKAENSPDGQTDSGEPEPAVAKRLEQAAVSVEIETEVTEKVTRETETVELVESREQAEEPAQEPVTVEEESRELAEEPAQQQMTAEAECQELAEEPVQEPVTAETERQELAEEPEPSQAATQVPTQGLSQNDISTENAGKEAAATRLSDEQLARKALQAAMIARHKKKH